MGEKKDLHPETKELIEKYDGGVAKEIRERVREYVELHKIVDSPVPEERINRVLQRNDELNPIRKGLENIISQNLGAGVYADKAHADQIIEALVAKGYDVDGVKLPEGKKPEDAKKKEELINKYLSNAGVDYTQLVIAIMNTRNPTSMAELPDGHLLKTLVTYLVNQTHPEQRRIAHLQQRIRQDGTVRRTDVAQAFNDYDKLELDPRYATPENALEKHAQLTRARAEKFEAYEPHKVHNATVKLPKPEGAYARVGK